MVTINFQQAMQQAKNASFDPLPQGEYDVVCIEAKPTESSTHKPMIRARYQVESGPHAGKKVFNQYTFSADNDNALSFFFQHMGFHGLDQTFFAANPALEQVSASLVGRRVRFAVNIREWQGQPRNNVERIMPPASPTAGVMPTAQPIPQIQPQPPAQHLPSQLGQPLPVQPEPQTFTPATVPNVTVPPVEIPTQEYAVPQGSSVPEGSSVPVPPQAPIAPVAPVAPIQPAIVSPQPVVAPEPITPIPQVESPQPQPQPEVQPQPFVAETEPQVAPPPEVPF